MCESFFHTNVLAWAGDLAQLATSIDPEGLLGPRGPSNWNPHWTKWVPPGAKNFYGSNLHVLLSSSPNSRAAHAMLTRLFRQHVPTLEW
ncbi:hypothetical protein MRB53_015694 [Persea americana]|uniref:Uncharacterized protein n=1 Tax=Persea americana TaxID=3435 RepID=A0ACC2M043_PERAE|nr:hypothetical protein MRB53_015694 [Persea americana]